jgi:DNA-directed RNA polymerase specialized sigma24 family protein
MSVEGNRSSDTISVLAALYPALVQAARIYLSRYDVVGHLPEDLVQDASVRWFSSHIEFRNGGQLYLWFAKTMKRMAIDASERSEDVMDGEYLSLDELTDGGE